MDDVETGPTLIVRPIRIEDADRCGHVAFAAHQAVARRLGIPSEQPSAEFATGLIKGKIADPNSRGLVAESAGDIVGSVFLNRFPPAAVAAVGPLTAHPEGPAGIGGRLLRALLADVSQSELPSIRLVQSPSHLESLALYAKTGFILREPLVLMQGKCPDAPGQADCCVRSATESDVAACGRLSERVHGLAGSFELAAAIRQGSATVLERSGRIAGYTAGVGFRGHAVAETTPDLQSLLALTPQTPGPGSFVPTRNGALLRWLLEGGVRMLWPAALMTRGDYREATGAFLPSIAL